MKDLCPFIITFLQEYVYMGSWIFILLISQVVKYQTTFKLKFYSYINVTLYQNQEWTLLVQVGPHCIQLSFVPTQHTVLCLSTESTTCFTGSGWQWKEQVYVYSGKP